jgi:hypothetical protein
MSFYTYADAIEALIDYSGANGTESVLRDARRSVLEAYREFVDAHQWTYLYTHSRIVTQAPYTGVNVSGVQVGQIQYQQSSGQYPYQVTLSGDTWPSWALYGYLRIGGVNYRPSQVMSATVLTLDPILNPGVDLPLGTEFSLYQDTYLLPVDYTSQDEGLYQANFGGMQYAHPREWLFENRYVMGQGVPHFYTIRGSDHVPGRLVISVFPAPSASATIDYIYKRRCRALAIQDIATGTVSVGNGSNVVAGVGTSFAPNMVGSVIRLSSTTVPPSSPIGNTPPAWEDTVASYTSSTQIVTTGTAPQAFTSVGYRISDRCCEWQLSQNRTFKDKPSARLQYLAALERAKAADSRSFAGRHEGQPSRYPLRLRDMPAGPDVS